MCSLASGMSVPMASTVSRFPAEEFAERVLGPDTYNPKDPCAPLLMVHDRSRKTANFRSVVDQRPPITSDRTESFVAPGTYDPSYNSVFPDVSRHSQFSDKKSQVFASLEQRFKLGVGVARIATPDSRWSLTVDAKEWVSNRNGGGCWGKADRMSGTLAQFLKQREEAAQMSAGAGIENGEGSTDGPTTGAAGRVGSAGAGGGGVHYVSPVNVPLDMCFKDLTECMDLVCESHTAGVCSSSSSSIRVKAVAPPPPPPPPLPPPPPPQKQQEQQQHHHHHHHQ